MAKSTSKVTVQVMKTKQYSLKVFEVQIEQESEFLAFLEKNRLLLQNHLLHLKGSVTPIIEKTLRTYKLRYTKDLSEIHSFEGAQKSRSSFEVIDSLVRSGQEIKIEGDLLLLGRVNDGATIITSGSCIALGRVDGMIICEGSLLFIRPTNKTKILYHDADLTDTMHIDHFQLVSFENDKITITQYDTKDLNGNDILRH